MTHPVNDNETSADDDYASPPCLLHLVDPETGALIEDRNQVDARQRTDVARWRKAERERLIALRLTIPAALRRVHAERIAFALDRALGDLSGRIVSVYWPFRGEPDLLAWTERLVDRGIVCALPVVVRPRAPLVFRAWHRGALLQPGVWNIPVPSDGSEVTPDVVIAPVVGFDRENYRLGHGGGFFDRTLAVMSPKPRIVGVGYDGLAIPTIYPQPHDIPMDMIVTETGVVARA